MKCDNCGEQITKTSQLVVVWNEDWKIGSDTFNKDTPKFVFHKQGVKPGCDDSNKYPLNKTFPSGLKNEKNEASLEEVEEYLNKERK